MAQISVSKGLAVGAVSIKTKSNTLLDLMAEVRSNLQVHPGKS